MNTQTFDLSTALLSKLQALQPDRQQQLLEFAEFLLQQQTQAAQKPSDSTTHKKRVLGLHQGMGWISDDFNEPLPDEFWFGNDA